MAESLSNALITYLKSIPAINALVNAGGDGNARIFKQVPKPGTRLPFIVIEEFEGESHEHLGGITGLARQRVQIDCYQIDQTLAHTLAELVRLAPLQGHGNFTMSTLDVRDVSSASGYRTGVDPPPQAGQQHRHWKSRDYFITYREPTS